MAAIPVPPTVVAEGAAPAPSAGPRYVEPGWLTRNAVNRPIAWLTRRGLSVWG